MATIGHSNSSAFSGVGSVMGNKRLKAIVVRGTKDINFANGLNIAVKDIDAAVKKYTEMLEQKPARCFVSSKGEGVFLLSLRSDNVEEDMGKMKEAGAAFVMDQPLKGSFGTANFIHPKSTHGVQIEVYD